MSSAAAALTTLTSVPHPDDRRFRPDDTGPDTYDVGEDYGTAPAPGAEDTDPAVGPVQDDPAPAPSPPPVRHDLPYGATGAHAGDASAPPAAAPWHGVTPGAPPQTRPGGAGGSPAVSPFRQADGRGPGWRVTWPLAMLAGLVLLSLVTRACAGSGDDGAGSSGGGSGATPTPQVEASWVVTPADLTPLAATWELELNIDGAFTGAAFVDAGDVLVVGFGPRDAGAQALAGLDATDGTLLWSRELADVLCGDQVFDGALACVAREDDSWRYRSIDPRTGDDLATAEVGIADVQTVHAGPDALVVVGPASPAPHADVAAFAPDGTQLWKVDAGTVDGAELLFDDLLASEIGGDPGSVTMERPRWRDLDGGLMMLWSTPGVAIIDPTAGFVVVHECLRATPAHDRYFCQDDAGINRRDLAGEIVWSTPDLDLVYVDDTSDARPMAVNDAFEVIPLDWETGEVIAPAIHRFTPRPNGFTGSIMGPSAGGDAQAQYLVQDGDVVVRISDDVDAVDWVFYGDEDTSYIDGVHTLDGVAVLDSYTLIGLDDSSGDELWRLRSPYGIYNHLTDVGLVAIGFDEIALLDLP